jgi:hypothetical protein
MTLFHFLQRTENKLFRLLLLRFTCELLLFTFRFHALVLLLELADQK